MRLSPRAASWLALAGLLVILCAISAYAIRSDVTNQRDVEGIERAVVLNNAYHDAIEGLTEAQLFVERYRHDPAISSEGFQPIAERIRSALTSIMLLGEQEDRDVVLQIYAASSADLAAARKFFAAAGQGEINPSKLPDPELPNRLKQTLSEPAARREAATHEDIARVRDSEDLSLVVTFTVFSTGIALILAFIAILRRFGRKQMAVDLEMAHLREAATRDPLTGLGNQRAFEESLDEALSTAADRGRPVVLMLIDVDEFKRTNDTWGHDRGDSVLRELAQTIRGQISPTALAFRIGGDEFAVLMPGADLASGLVIGESIRSRVERELAGSAVSVGVAATSPDQEHIDASVLRQQADSALYDAKGRGRNTVAGFHPASSVVPLFPSAKIESFRALLSARAISTAFQPIWNLEYGSLVAYEALARPESRFGLATAEMFQIAERVGRVQELDAICHASILARANQLPDGALLFVNVSPHTLEHPAFSAAAFARAVTEAGIEAGRVVVEVTERASVPVGLLAEHVSRLRQSGFRIAIDDVGSGNAGLELLRQIPVDYVKVDRNVVASATVDAMGRAVFMAIIAFAAEAGALVVAEGIDQDAMLELVQELSAADPDRPPARVHAVQGYLFGAPSGVLQVAPPTALLGGEHAA